MSIASAALASPKSETVRSSSLVIVLRQKIPWMLPETGHSSNPNDRDVREEQVLLTKLATASEFSGRQSMDSSVRLQDTVPGKELRMAVDKRPLKLRDLRVDGSDASVGNR